MSELVPRKERFIERGEIEFELPEQHTAAWGDINGARCLHLHTPQQGGMYYVDSVDDDDDRVMFILASGLAMRSALRAPAKWCLSRAATRFLLNSLLAIASLGHISYTNWSFRGPRLRPENPGHVISSTSHSAPDFGSASFALSGGRTSAVSDG